MRRGMAMATGGFLLLLAGSEVAAQGPCNGEDLCNAWVHFTKQQALLVKPNGDTDLVDVAGSGVCGVTAGQAYSQDADGEDYYVSFCPSDSPLTLACTYRYVNNKKCSWRQTVSCSDTNWPTVDLSCDPGRISVGVITPDGQICYQVAVQGYGWMNPVCDGTVAGTIGQGRRVEAFAAWSTLPGVSICYQAHIQNRGWVAEGCDRNVVGTWGSGLRVEGLRLRASAPFEVKYRAQVQNIGWQGIVSSYNPSQFAGTTGQGLRLEAISARVGQTANCIMVGDRPLRCTDATVSQYMSTVASGAVSQYWCSPNLDPRSSCASISSSGTCTQYGSSGRYACVTEIQ